MMASRVCRSRRSNDEVLSVMAGLSSFLARYSRTPKREHSLHLLLYGGSLVLVLSLWHRTVLHALPFRAVASLALIVAASLAYGRAFVGSTALARSGQSSLTLEFLG